MRAVLTHNLLWPLAVSLVAHSAIFLSLAAGWPGTQEAPPAPVRITWQQEPGSVPPVSRMGDERRLRNQEKMAGRNDAGRGFAAGQNNHTAQGQFAQPQLRGDAQESMLRYQDDVKRRLEALRNYPALALRQRQQGEALVRFVVTADGACARVEIVRSSGTRLLDEEAVNTVRRAVPFSPLPVQLGLDRVVMNVALVFKMD